MRHSSYVISRIHQQKADRLEQRAHTHRLLKNPDQPSLRSTVASWLVAVARRLDTGVVTTPKTTPPSVSRH